MSHLLREKASVFLCAVISFSAIVSAQNVDPTFFNATTLIKIMAHRECEGVRFYNFIKPGSDQFTILAAGIRADESEIVNWSNRYYVFMNASVEGLVYNKLSRKKAAAACQAVKDKGVVSFSASFTKSEVNAMLQSSSKSGAFITENTMNALALTTCEAQAGIHSRGKFDPVSGTEPTQCTKPCPTFCGISSNYLNR
jgi:hypothetical protein